MVLAETQIMHQIGTATLPQLLGSLRVFSGFLAPKESSRVPIALDGGETISVRPRRSVRLCYGKKAGTVWSRLG